MEDNILNVNAKLTSVHPLINGNFSLIFKTEELTTENKMSILQFHQKEGSLTFTEVLTNKNIQTIEDTEQTQLQRLKAQLKLKYDLLDTNIPFQEWYTNQLGIIIKLIREDKIL